MKVETLAEIAKRMANKEKPSYYKKSRSQDTSKGTGNGVNRALLRALGAFLKKK